MNEETQHREETQRARDVIEQIWKRARINAFAHKEAYKEFSCKSIIIKFFVFLFSVSAVLFVMFQYILIIQLNDENETIHLFNILNFKFLLKHLPFFLLVLSIVFSFAAIILNALNNILSYGIKAESHKFFLGSFQHLAQRARESKWPDKPKDEMIELLKDLERDFALLKARCDEPSDKQFNRALKIFKKIQTDKDSASAQSFSENQIIKGLREGEEINNENVDVNIVQSVKSQRKTNWIKNLLNKSIGKKK